MAIVKGIAGASGGTNTSDATAEQGDIRTGVTAYIASGKVTGTGYFPGTMKYDGSTGYHSLSGITSSGNHVRALVMAQRAAAGTGGESEFVFQYQGPTYIRLLLVYFDSDHPDADRANRWMILIQSSAGAELWRAFSPAGLALGSRPVPIYVSFDGSTGAGVFRVGSADADDTGNADRTAPTTGTLDAGASSICTIGAGISDTNHWAAEIGFCAIDDSHDADWTQYIDADGNLKQVSLTAWKVFSPNGDLRDNRGALSDFTANGTIRAGDSNAV